MPYFNLYSGETVTTVASSSGCIVKRISNLPFETADIRFTLHPENGSTIVKVSPLYQLKYGVMGELLDRVYVRNSYKRGMESLLAGLKAYVEREEN